MSTTTELVDQVRTEFLQRNANLLALTRNGANDVMRRVTAALALDADARDNVTFYSDDEYLNQPVVIARNEARASFKAELYRQTCRAFLRVQDRSMIEYVSKRTPEALEELKQIQIAAGEIQPEPVVPAQPQPSAQELLDQEVIADYNGAIPVDKMRAKFKTNPAYKATLDRLLASGELK
jgi:hypothetical protein